MSGYKPARGRRGIPVEGLVVRWAAAGLLNKLQALLSQSCPVMTAFWKHAAVGVLMPPCRWERTGWENWAVRWSFCLNSGQWLSP